MRRIAAVLLMAALLAAAFCGCHMTRTGTPATGKLPPAYMTEAVLRTFTDIFDGTWGGVTVYIHKSAWVPEDLKKAGKNPVEITTIKDLVKKHEDSEVAPAIAIVDASQDEVTGLIKVTVKYTPVRIKALELSTKGGTFEYTYQLVSGKLIMIASLKPLIDIRR